VFFFSSVVWVSGPKPYQAEFFFLFFLSPVLGYVSLPDLPSRPIFPSPPAIGSRLPWIEKPPPWSSFLIFLGCRFRLLSFRVVCEAAVRYFPPLFFSGFFFTPHGWRCRSRVMVRIRSAGSEPPPPPYSIFPFPPGFRNLGSEARAHVRSDTLSRFVFPILERNSG